MITRKSTRQGLLLVDNTPSVLVPIYGLTEVPISKRSNWESDPAFISTVQMKNWTGDPPVEFSFTWSLIAGTNPEVDSRTKLLTYIRRIHSMCSFKKVPTGGSELVGPPPKVRLILGDYVAAVGVLTEVSTNAKGPFTNQTSGEDSSQTGGIGNMEPSQVDFSITFIALPGYSTDGVPLVNIDKAMTYDSDSVLARLYKTF